MPEVECILVEEHQPEGPYGAKGVGEGPLVPTASRRRRCAVRVRRDPPDPPADEGLARRTRGRSPARGPDAGPATHHALTADPRDGAGPVGATVVDSLAHRRRRPTSSFDDGRVAELGPDVPGGAPPSDRLRRVPWSSPATSAGTPTSIRPWRAGCPTGDLAPPANFVQILQRVWWRLDRALDEESVRASALVGGMEALLAGTTTAGRPPRVAERDRRLARRRRRRARRSSACARCSATRRPTATGRAGASGRRGEPAVPRATVARRRDRSPADMVGAHASFTLSHGDARRVRRRRRTRPASGIHIHVAEDAADEGDCDARGSASRSSTGGSRGRRADRDAAARALRPPPPVGDRAGPRSPARRSRTTRART